MQSRHLLPVPSEPPRHRFPHVKNAWQLGRCQKVWGSRTSPARRVAPAGLSLQAGFLPRPPLAARSLRPLTTCPRAPRPVALPAPTRHTHESAPALAPPWLHALGPSGRSCSICPWARAGPPCRGLRCLRPRAVRAAGAEVAPCLRPWNP